MCAETVGSNFHQVYSSQSIPDQLACTLIQFEGQENRKASVSKFNSLQAMPTLFGNKFTCTHVTFTFQIT